MTPVSHEALAAFVGLDWADATYAVCLQVAGSATRACFQLEHTPEAIDAWVTTLRTRCNGQPIAICLALHKGPLVSALRTYDFLILFPIHPLTLARYREAFTPSRAQDDPTDAARRLALLLTHRDKLQGFPSLPPPRLSFVCFLRPEAARTPHKDYVLDPRPLVPTPMLPQSPVLADALQVCHPHAAGIDSGEAEHWVAVPPGAQRGRGALPRLSAGGGGHCPAGGARHGSA